MNMSNDVHHSVALQALDRNTLESERKKAKAEMTYKLLNDMGPISLTNLFPYTGEMTKFIFEIFQVTFAYRNRVLII